jgi:hypothetical protein
MTATTASAALVRTVDYCCGILVSACYTGHEQYVPMLMHYTTTTTNTTTRLRYDSAIALPHQI